MSREAHVRICKGVGVRFPHATRLERSRPSGEPQIEDWFGF
jgi:hypothetical protein